MSQDLTLEAEKDPYSQWSFQDVFNEDCIVLDPVSVLPIQYEITNCLLPISRGKMLKLIIYLEFPHLYSSFILIYSHSWQIPNCTRWTAPVCHIAHLKAVCIYLFFSFFPSWSYNFEGLHCVSDLSAWPTYRFKLPAAPFGSFVQHVRDVTGVQSAGAGTQSDGELVRQLPATCHL